MRYWHPLTDQALAEIEADGVNTLVVVPLYPQFSISTSGSSMRVLREAFLTDVSKWGPSKLRHTVVPSWYDRPGYVKAIGRLIRAEVRERSNTKQLPRSVCMSAVCLRVSP
jgi:protoporphyrin/coproporphyrin ferrochelatase